MPAPDHIAKLTEAERQTADHQMRAAVLAGRVHGLIDVLDTYNNSLQESPNDPRHIDSYRHVRDRLNDALNEYLNSIKPF